MPEIAAHALNPGLRLHAVTPEYLAPLCDLFSRIQNDPASQHFHPHPFTEEEAQRCCAHTGKDFYGIAFWGHNIVGYGMLRGWDEGYAVPSLGIYLVPEMRGKGLSKPFMLLLHAEVANRGAGSVRLTVYASNKTALGLYRSLGYVFDGEETGKMVGRVNLAMSCGLLPVSG